MDTFLGSLERIEINVPFCFSRSSSKYVSEKISLGKSKNECFNVNLVVSIFRFIIKGLVLKQFLECSFSKNIQGSCLSNLEPVCKTFGYIQKLDHC